MQTPPQTELVRIALDRTNGTEFETFVLSFLSSKLGAAFVPLGGLHDGGADGLVDTNIFMNNDRQSAFMQASIDRDPIAKIRRTMRRLREVGREPSELLYVTSQVIPRIDLEQETLSGELGASVRIMDGNYIIYQVPTDSGSISAYYEHLHHQTQYLQGIGRGAVLSSSEHVSDPHVYTYLVGQIDRELSNGSFVDGVLDALIVFALEGTDPTEGILMSESDIRAKILETLPTSKAILDDCLRHRLETMSRKPQRRIRWHQHEDRWALPYDDRKELEDASIEDESLRIEVRQELTIQFSSLELPPDVESTQLADLTLATIQLAFEDDGLRFSAFLEDGTPSDSTPFVSDALRSAMSASSLTGDTRLAAADAVLLVLRDVFYSSTPRQRTLLQRISRAYGILFALQGEPRVLRYFDDAMTNTHLYVGSDVLVSALSERYVQPEDQHTRNLLKSAHLAGATLILAAPVLDEVLGHLRASDREYTNYVQPMGSLEYELATHQPKILVRAFLYSQVSSTHTRPKSWDEFVNQFCTYQNLHHENATIQLQRYLTSQFSLQFTDWPAILDVCDEARNMFLKNALMPLKGSDFLASNDAYIYQLVTHRRSLEGTADDASEFGYQTWWLSSGEGAAVRAMAHADHGTTRILMRPEFLEKFILLSPSAAQARQSMSDFLPSLLGIKIARRVAEDDYHKMMDSLKEAESLETGGRAAKIADFTDRLRTARHGELDEQFSPETSGDSLPVDLEDGS
ncbi:MAG: hypothetical protein F4Y27_01745 [Acidimicrobiaceae bacterium]|nr:hypothetical protein [Acidimicrobiaceae bacterium]MYG54827.1 hypothetical protein [Acidimicrobiaceae bacterium]MYJ99225.1 hypothetical protein [Acidimicrobiaceae bacterium]